MHLAPWRRLLTVLWLGLRLRCPACGRGRLFDRRFHLRPTCPYCGVRFERSRGEALGGRYLNAGLTLVLALAGYFITGALVTLPALVLAGIWVAFALLFPVVFYHAARGAWVAIAYLTGGVYSDPDYLRQYVRPPSRRTRQGAHRPR